MLHMSALRPMPHLLLICQVSSGVSHSPGSVPSAGDCVQCQLHKLTCEL